MSVVFWPGVSVRGAAGPDVLKPGPVVVKLEIVRLAVPVFETVSTCESVLPTITLPKFADEGLKDILAVPGFVAIPMPVRLIVVASSLALLTIEMLPDAPPAAEGLKETLNDMFCPAGTVAVLGRLASVKAVPTVLTCEIIKSAVPLFARSIDCVTVAPTLTFPKFTVVGVMEIVGEAEPVVGPAITGFPVTPMQLAVPMIAQRAIKLATARSGDEVACWPANSRCV